MLESENRPLHAREIAARMRVSEADYLGLQRLLDDLSFEGVLSTRAGQHFKVSPKTAGARGAERQGLLTVQPARLRLRREPRRRGRRRLHPARGDARRDARRHGRPSACGRAGARGAEGEIVAVVDRGDEARRRARSGAAARARGSSRTTRACAAPSSSRARSTRAAPRATAARRRRGRRAHHALPRAARREPGGRARGGARHARASSASRSRRSWCARASRRCTPPTPSREAEAYGAEVPADDARGARRSHALPLPDDRSRGRARSRRRGLGRAHRRRRLPRLDRDRRRRARTCGRARALDEEAHGARLQRSTCPIARSRCSRARSRRTSARSCPTSIRLCLCVEVELDAQRRRREDAASSRGFMRAAAKLTYGGVARALGFTERARRASRRPRRWSRACASPTSSRASSATRRMKRGALDFDLPEAEDRPRRGRASRSTSRSAPQRSGREEGLPAHRRADAPRATRRSRAGSSSSDVPTIFRVHAPPDEQKLERFAAMCEALGIEFDVEDTRDPKKLSRPPEDASRATRSRRSSTCCSFAR